MIIYNIKDRQILSKDFFFFIRRISLILRKQLPYVCVFVYQKRKEKRMGNCSTLLKKVYYVYYNLSFSSLKVIMAFKWSYDVPFC